MPIAIRITSIPPGEAPEAVRKAWVGLELPLAKPTAAPSTVPTAGVVSGPRGFLAALVGLFTGRVREAQGYVVKVPEAMAVLAAKAPEAERWWRENTPHLFVGSRSFVFAASCAEPVGGQPSQREIDAAQPASLAKMLGTLLLLLAVDASVPVLWRSGWIGIIPIKVWVVWAGSCFVTLVTLGNIVARLRAQREAERARSG
jgi:hypothetical protein